MSMHHDPELDDVLQDDELRRLARLLSATRRAEPPLDEAFRSGLRRQLMQQADRLNERRAAGWRRIFAPSGLAWAGAAVGLLLIASTVVFINLQQPAVVNQIVVGSAINGSHNVQLQQPILLSFNQPMDQAATQAAVQVQPATSVTFVWQDARTLAIQPVSGTLAPNTQYQVTIGPGAKTAASAPASVTLTAPQVITFVTQPQAPPTPSPSPRPSPTPGSLLTGETQLATGCGTTPGAVQWSPDSATVYFVTSSGALESVASKGGAVTVLAPDGVTSQALAPAGDTLAYVRGGKIETLVIAAGTTTELAPTPPATAVGWAKDKLVWTASDGVYTQGSSGPSQLAALPAKGAIKVLSIAPDGGHVAYQQDQSLLVLDVAGGKSSPLGDPGATFLGWSPSGAQLLFSSSNGVAVSDLQGHVAATLAAGQPSWSARDAILLGGDASLSQVRPDGTASTKLADGTYDFPWWAPDGTTFAFFRSGAIWVATAPVLPPRTTTPDQAAAVVNSFMQARLKGQADQAGKYLDSNGQQAYAAGPSLKLLPVDEGTDSRFSRFYILLQEITGTEPGTVRFVVRLVFSRQQIDVSTLEETLTLMRDPASGQFAIDQAKGGYRRVLGKGAEVVAVDVTRSEIRVSFDSDLDPSSVTNAVRVVDSNGDPVGATAAYANRTVTLSGLELKPGQRYALVVSSALRDVLGHMVSSEYNLVILGPVDEGVRSGPGAPAPSPAAPSASPAPTA